MTANYKSSFQSEQASLGASGMGFRACLGWGEALRGWEKERRKGRVRRAWFWCSFSLASFLFPDGLSPECFLSTRRRIETKQSMPGDDGRSKKPNLQAADGVWSTPG